MRKAATIPAAIVGLTLLAFLSANTYRVPTLDVSFVDTPAGTVRTVEYTVDGLRCRGTAVGLARMIAGVPGAVSVTVYARTRTAIVRYDPDLTGADEIRRVFTSPVVRGGVSHEVFRVVGERDLD